MRRPNKRLLPPPAQCAQRKLSEIILEIARIGFREAYRDTDPMPHAGDLLAVLAVEAWNLSLTPKEQAIPVGKLNQVANEFRITDAKIQEQLISQAIPGV